MSRDFVEFINSEDVKKYVRESGYQLSSQEAAFVVWQSKNTPLEERFAAWEEIIETMPDSSFVGYGNFNFETWQMEPAPVYSLHDFLRQYIQRQKELLDVFTKEGDGTYTLEKREGPWVGGEINDWFYSDCRYGSYKDLLDDIKAEHGSAFFDRLRAAKVTNRGSRGTRNPMSRIYILDYDMDARPLRFVYRDDFRHQSLYPDDLEKLFSKLEVHIPAPFRQGDILWDPSGEPGIPYEEDSTPFVLDYIPNWNEAEQAANGFAPGEKFYQRKGEREKYESPMQDPPLDYGAYGVTVVAGGQLHQAYNGFACYLDLEPYHGPLEGTFAALKPISEYIKGNLTEDLLLNSVLALLHQPRRERTLSISLTTAVRKSPEEP